MANKIFKAIIALVSLAITILFVIFMFVAYNFAVKMEQERLEIEMDRVEYSVNLHNQDYIQELAKRGMRMTLIKPDGKVLFDNEIEASVADNHLDRDEIKAALDNKLGRSVRFSDSLNNYNIYIAKKLDNGDILRLSMHRDSLIYILGEMSIPIILMIILMLYISYKVAKRVSKKIVEPINKINLEHPLENDIDDELWPLMRRIDDQNELIEDKTNLLTRRKKEFIAIIENLSEALILLNVRYEVVGANKVARELFMVNKGENFLRYNRNERLRKIINNVKLYGHYESKDIKIKDKNFYIKGNVIDENIISLLAIDVTERAQREEMRRNFTANVSHELRTPLQSIMGSAELLEAGLVAPEDVKKFTGTIYKESKRLLALINDLLHLAKLDDKKAASENKQSVFNLKDVIENVAESLAVIAAKKNIEIELDLVDVEIKNYEDLVFEILYNLVDNSIKYGRENGKVKVQLADGKQGLITITDDGIGIPESEQNRVFERFYRVEKARSQEKIQGTGLGLAIVKHGVKICGGEIKLQSKLGVGTTIEVHLSKDIEKM